MTATPSSPPIACSLTADALSDRETEWQALLSGALISRTFTPGGLRIELQNLPGVRRQLERLVAAERECCPFMMLNVDTTGQLLALTAIAPEHAAPILEQMLAGGG